MWHQADDVALAIADSGDCGQRAIGIRFAVVFRRHLLRPVAGRATVGMDVAEHNLVIALEVRERSGVDEIISFHVRDRHFQHLASARGAGEGRVGVLDANMDLAAEKPEPFVAHHRAGKQSSFEKDLKAVADAEDETAGAREAVDGAHHRRKAGDGASAEVVAEREAAGEDDGVESGNVFRLVPDEVHRLTHNRSNRVIGVMVAIGTRKLHHSEFHQVPPAMHFSTGEKSLGLAGQCYIRAVT